MKKLLVLGSQQINYYDLFKDCKVGGETVIVEHCTWNDISICSYGDNGGLVVNISPSIKPRPNTPQEKVRSFSPDFILLRAGCRGDARTDWRYKLSVIAHSNIPTINKIQSFYDSQDKALLYGKLLNVKKRLGGFKNFPLISQGCYSDWRSATFPPDTPCVGKVGTASGGLGKMKINTSEEWEDFCSVMAMQEQTFTSEPFIKWDYDIRIQKIGNHYRAFRRTAKHWKSNVDIAMKDEDIPVEERYKVWLEEAAYECQMDICAMDVLRIEENGKEFILELNSSAIGLNGRHSSEDIIYIRDLVLRRMEEAFTEKYMGKLIPITIKDDSIKGKKSKVVEKKKKKKHDNKGKDIIDDPKGKEHDDVKVLTEKTKDDDPVRPSYELLLKQVKDLQAEIEQLTARISTEENSKRKK